MTLTELTNIVRVLANSCYVRYWRHYNYPATPALMAISVIGSSDLSALDKDLLARGFEFVEHDTLNIWTIQRTDLVADFMNALEDDRHEN
jgi:hypothetical protein